MLADPTYSKTIVNDDQQLKAFLDEHLTGNSKEDKIHFKRFHFDYDSLKDGPKQIIEVLANHSET